MIGDFFLELDKMCYVPGLNGTLLSLSCLAEQGWSTTIAKVDGVNAATLTRGDDILLEVPLCDGLYLSSLQIRTLRFGKRIRTLIVMCWRL